MSRVGEKRKRKKKKKILFGKWKSQLKNERQKRKKKSTSRVKIKSEGVHRCRELFFFLHGKLWHCYSPQVQKLHQIDSGI